MGKSRTYVLSGGLFALIAIAVTARHDVVPGIMMFLAAIACALRAHDEWKREQQMP